MGVAALRKCQYGLEGTHGTAVAADTMLLCRSSVPAGERTPHIPQVDMGVRTPGLLAGAIVQRQFAEFTLEDADGAYFELFPLLFSLGIKNITPSGGADPYTWTAAAPQTGAETVDTATFELGDDDQAYEMEYCAVRSFQVSGDCVTGECHVSAEVFGRQAMQTTITGSIAVPTVELITARLSRIYVNDTWAALGGGELASSLINWQIQVNTGVHPKFVGGQTRYFNHHEQGAITGQATFTFERNAAVAAEELKYRPASGYTVSPRFVRVVTAGLGTHALTFDMAGVWTEWNSLGAENEGNTQDVATLTFGYDTTGAQSLSCAVVTSIGAV